MSVYLVERDLPGVTLEQLAAAQKKAIQVGIELTAQGKEVRYIRSTFVPGKHKCSACLKPPIRRTCAKPTSVRKFPLPASSAPRI